MTDPKDLPPEVRRHLERQRQHQSQPIPTDRPTLEQLTSGPAFTRSRLLKAAIDAGDEQRAEQIRRMSDAEIENLKES